MGSNVTLNSNFIAQNPEFQQKAQYQENFTALDKEKFKQDTVEITSKAQKEVKDNAFIRALKNLGVEDPKKFLKSLAMTLATVGGLMFLGNKLSTKSIKLGNSVDVAWKETSLYKGIKNVL